MIHALMPYGDPPNGIRHLELLLQTAADVWVGQWDGVPVASQTVGSRPRTRDRSWTVFNVRGADLPVVVRTFLKLAPIEDDDIVARVDDDCEIRPSIFTELIEHLGDAPAVCAPLSMNPAVRVVGTCHVARAAAARDPWYARNFPTWARRNNVQFAPIEPVAHHGNRSRRQWGVE